MRKGSLLFSDMIITSEHNEAVSEVKKLLDKKYRKLLGKYVIEGERLVADAIRYGADVQRIFIRAGSEDKFSFADATVVEGRVFDKMTDTVCSQGVLAVVRIKTPPLAPPQGNALVLDGLQDPGNVGTLIRTAAACGFTDVYAVNCADVYSPKTLRAAMSAHFCVNVYLSEDISAVLKLQGGNLLAADMAGENVFCVDVRGRTTLVVGNEGNGLSAESRRAAKLVSLPMRNGFESLNAAVAGSVIMYQINHKNMQ